MEQNEHRVRDPARRFHLHDHGEYRVALSDDDWLALDTTFQRIGRQTNQEMQWWGDAAFRSSALSIFITEVDAALHDPGLKPQHEILAELLRVATFAHRTGKTLSLLGD